jgi:hypothetical protein
MEDTTSAMQNPLSSFSQDKAATFEEEDGGRGARSPGRPGQEEQENVVAGRALFLLGPDAQIRHTLNDFCNNPAVDKLLLGCILLNVCILAVQTPMNTHSEDFNLFMDNLDHVLSVIFSIEMVMRIIALGFVLHPTAYLRSSWYVLDFVVVFSIWVSWGVMFTGGTGGANISYIRTVRALRPLRSLRSFPYVKLIMSSLYGAIAMFVNVSAMLVFIFVIATAVGLQLFAGAVTHRCDQMFDDTVPPAVSDGGNLPANSSGSSSWSTFDQPDAPDWVCHKRSASTTCPTPCMECSTVVCPPSMHKTW